MAEKDSSTSNGWSEWSKYVLKSIDDLTDKLESIQKDVQSLRLEVAIKIHQSTDELRRDLENINKSIAVLQVRSSIMGAVFGVVGSAIIMTIMYVVRGIALDVLKS